MIMSSLCYSAKLTQPSTATGHPCNHAGIAISPLELTKPFLIYSFLLLTLGVSFLWMPPEHVLDRLSLLTLLALISTHLQVVQLQAKVTACIQMDPMLMQRTTECTGAPCRDRQEASTTKKTVKAHLKNSFFSYTNNIFITIPQGQNETKVY